MDWTTGLTDFHLKHTGMLFNMVPNLHRRRKILKVRGAKYIIARNFRPRPL